MSKNVSSEHQPKDHSIGDRRLAQQFATTGDLMDLCSDETWLKSSASGADEWEGAVEAGLAMRDYAAAVQSATPEQHQSLRWQMRLQSILFSELKTWMTTWELGLSFKATYTQARQLIRQHLQQPTPVQQTWITALLIEDEQRLEPDQKTVRIQTVSMLSQMLTDDDWQMLANTAAQGMAQSILQRGRLEVTVPIAV